MTWRTPTGVLVAREPDAAEIEQHAHALATAYNDPRNAALLGHTEDLDEREVIDSYLKMFDDGGYSFLWFRDGRLIADGDLRHVTAEAAEMAFLVTSVASQGQGLGTKIALMLHAFGFARLGLQRIYASILPGNLASRRVFEKLGHAIDDTPAGRGFADEPGDLVTVIDRAAFERIHAAPRAEIEIELRAPPASGG